MVTENTSFEVGYHDFTKFSLVPSACFVVNIPDSLRVPGILVEHLLP